MPDNKPTTYHVNPDVSCRVEGENEALLYNPDTDTICLLNGTGIMLWQFLSQARSEEEICAHLADQYEEAPDQMSLLSDVRTFLSQLGKEYLQKEPDNDS